MVAYVLLFATAALTSAAISPAVARLGHKVGLLDHPGGRKVHATAVPRLGGVALALALAAALGVAVLLDALPTVAVTPDPSTLLPTIAGATLVFAVGLWDDVEPVAAWVKLLVECAAAAIAVGAGLAFSQVTVGGTTYQIGHLAAPLTIAWILLITNAFNLMDGLDGLAAGLAAIAASTCAVVLLARDERAAALLLVSLTGAIAGFVAYNFHPARIFLGDSGSLLIGFLLAVTAITGQQKSATTLALGVPLLIFALPIAEAFFTVVRRLAAGQRHAQPGWRNRTQGLTELFKADRAHIHHRLIDRGLSHRRTVLVLYALAAAFSALALLTMQAR